MHLGDLEVLGWFGGIMVTLGWFGGTRIALGFFGFGCSSTKLGYDWNFVWCVGNKLLKTYILISCTKLNDNLNSKPGLQ